MTLWVNHVIPSAGSDFRFGSDSDRIAALRQVRRRAQTRQLGRDILPNIAAAWL